MDSVTLESIEAVLIPVSVHLIYDWDLALSLVLQESLAAECLSLS